MAEPEVDFWSATVQAFAPLQLPSPELVPKLLKRPPFRYIHDLVTAINARFAAYTHIFPPELLDPARMDTKEKKIEYLTLLVDYVGKLLKRKIDVNPKKIVAGNEPEKTNAFLQCVASAVGLAQQDKTTRSRSPEVATPQTVPSPPLPGDDRHPSPEAKKKKKRTSSSSKSNSPAPSSTSPTTSRSPAQSPTVSNTAAPGATALPGSVDGLHELPSRASLPRKRSSMVSNAEKKSDEDAVMATAASFNQKVSGFSINLDPSDRGVQEDGEKIVAMWKELQHPQSNTTPSQMPPEALEMAIKRQLDTIKQVQDLLQENERVIENIEHLLI